MNVKDYFQNKKGRLYKHGPVFDPQSIFSSLLLLGSPSAFPLPPGTDPAAGRQATDAPRYSIKTRKPTKPQPQERLSRFLLSV
jgi:hypothetical protein